MADPKQIEILKQGVSAWNEWRKEHPNAAIDLYQADLSKAELSDANLSGAFLHLTDLSEAKLIGATLRGANLRGAKLIRADLNRAKLMEADFRGADLRGADLSDAYLFRTNLYGATLIGARLSKAVFESTTMGFNNLSEVSGLEEVAHFAPSILGVETIRMSRGKIPEVFLRGCGLSDWEIESAKLYDPDLSNDEIINIQNKIYDLRASHALQISNLFISYSHADGKFVDKLEGFFIEKGIRFWRDVHHATAGPLEKQIDRAIRLNPTVLLILSEHSIKSDWVEHEVRYARDLQKETGRDVLCPVRLDDSWKTSPWPERIMEQVKEYEILDFSKWDDDVKFNEMFIRLINGLDLYYRKV